MATVHIHHPRPPCSWCCSPSPGPFGSAVRCAATGPGRRAPWPSTAAATGPCGRPGTPGSRQSCEASWRTTWPRRKHIWKPWKDAWEDFHDDFLGWFFGLEFGLMDGMEWIFLVLTGNQISKWNPLHSTPTSGLLWSGSTLRSLIPNVYSSGLGSCIKQYKTYFHIFPAKTTRPGLWAGRAKLDARHCLWLGLGLSLHQDSRGTWYVCHHSSRWVICGRTLWWSDRPFLDCRFMRWDVSQKSSNSSSSIRGTAFY